MSAQFWNCRECWPIWNPFSSVWSSFGWEVGSFAWGNLLFPEAKTINKAYFYPLCFFMVSVLSLLLKAPKAKCKSCFGDVWVSCYLPSFLVSLNICNKNS